MTRRTSYAAYMKIEANGLLSKARLAVYQELFQRGPMTAGELAESINMVRNNCATRLAELRDRGVVAEVGERECTVTHKNVIVWDVTDKLPVEPTESVDMENLPIKAAKDLGKKYDLDRVLIIATSTKHDRTYTVSWGKTKEDCGFAAMDIQKLRAVIKEQPTSLYEAKQVAARIRPDDVEGINGRDG